MNDLSISPFSRIGWGRLETEESQAEARFRMLLWEAQHAMGGGEWAGDHYSENMQPGFS